MLFFIVYVSSCIIIGLNCGLTNEVTNLRSDCSVLTHIIEVIIGVTAIQFPATLVIIANIVKGSSKIITQCLSMKQHVLR